MGIVWTDLARSSIASIARYIEEHFNHNVAEKAVLEIYNAAQRLAVFPRLGHAVQEWREFGEVRCLNHRQNQIYYLLEDGKVYIVIVWDGRQEPAKLLDLMLTFFAQANKS